MYIHLLLHSWRTGRCDVLTGRPCSRPLAQEHVAVVAYPTFLVYAGRIIGDMTPLGFPCFLASVRNCCKCLSVSFPCFMDAVRAAAVRPDRLPNTMRSSSEFPINRLRPWRPPEASPATNRFFTSLSELVSIFTPPFW